MIDTIQYPFLQHIQYAKMDSDIIAKMKGTFVERDRKKKEKKVKGADAAGAKKGVPGAAAPMVAGVPAAMPVSKALLATGCVQFSKYSQMTLSINVDREINCCEIRVPGQILQLNQRICISNP